MKTIYIDSDFMCHVTNDGTRTEIQTDYFDNLCDKAIELMRFVPNGEEWTRPDGRVIHGEFVQATNSQKIDELQRQAEMDDMRAALALLGVTE